MATPAQVLANRQNSTHSTGPRSIAGKAASSGNSYRHGLTSQQIVLPGEDATEYDELRRDLLKTYKPANAVERTLVEDIAASSWRLMRARRQETIILAKIAGDNPDPDVAIAEFFLEKPKEVGRLTRYITSFERAFYRALNKLEKLQKERRSAEREAALEAAAFAELLSDRQPVESTHTEPSIGFVSQNAKAADFSPARKAAAA
jgi:hypothetical protein